MGNDNTAFTILIVEDNPLWQSALTSRLTRAGYKTINAYDYAETVNHLERLNQMPDLAIVDLHLPNSTDREAFDGVQVLELLAERQIYAIVLSAHTRKISRKIAGKAHLVDQIDKLRVPIVLEEFQKSSLINDAYEAIFLDKIANALATVKADREAEGSPERLRNILKESKKQSR